MRQEITRILIADDHELLRRGLKGILAEAFPRLNFEFATEPVFVISCVLFRAGEFHSIGRGMR